MKRMWLFGAMSVLVVFMSQTKAYADTRIDGALASRNINTVHQAFTASPNFIAAQNAGVLQGVQYSGSNHEEWTNSASVSLRNDLYDANSGWLPIEGQLQNSKEKDIVVQVVPINSAGKERGTNFWTYSVPLTDRHFAATIRIPYQGTIELNVGVTNLSQGTFALAKGYAYTSIQNNTPDFTSQQLGLLESWMVNYDESSVFASLANRIVSRDKTTDGKIRDISHFVSQNIRYNWPAFNANNVPWQQATTTYRLKLGVCQDEAALAAALLRSLGIPTMPYQGVLYVDNQDDGSHEWDSVWDGHSWIWIDPTMNQVYYQDADAMLPQQVQNIYDGSFTAIWRKSHRDGRPADW